MSEQKTPAGTLAAVLRVVMPEHHWISYDWYLSKDNRRGNVRALDHCLFSDSKDDLARVVATLTPKQRTAFGDHLGERLDAPDYAEAITAPASVWLAALAAATGVEL